MGFNTVNSSDDVVTFTEINNGNSYVKIDISKLNREASYEINKQLGDGYYLQIKALLTEYIE